MNQKLLTNATEFLANTDDEGELYTTGVPGLSFFSQTHVSDIKCMIYEPTLCLILQGAKRTHFGSESLTLQAGQSVVVSHELPVMAQIIEASAQKPYIAMVYQLDLAQIRSLYQQIDERALANERARLLLNGEADAGLIEALHRLFELHARPLDQQVLLPMLTREIHYRILVSEQGGMLRELQKRDSHAQRIAKAISHIRADIGARFSAAKLADLAGMSLSTFHEHFKAVTAMTPLQYQKELRLTTAHRMLCDQGASVSSTAFEVGYESPTQFSREYSRKFGHPPSKVLATAHL